MNTAEDFIILQGHVYQHNKKKIYNKTLQTRENKKFPLFSEHTGILLNKILMYNNILLHLNINVF